jgi:adenosylcobinamide kinase/adenosylcobinamide-phosphate guanylyltransferase
MIELVVGGARSGKSDYALSQAELGNANLTFIATAEAKDGEMTARIERHRQQRSKRWKLIEETLHLSSRVEQFASDDVILVDCLSLWLSNWLCSEQAHHWHKEKADWLEKLQQSPAHWILVSNETGMGVTPMGDLSRQFIDESGWLHQQIAQLADRVTLVMFGIPQTLKPQIS